MKSVLAASLLIALAGCTTRVGGDEVKAAEYICQNYNGVQNIELSGVYVTMVQCRTGVRFRMPDVVTAYTEAVFKDNTKPNPTPQPEASK